VSPKTGAMNSQFVPDILVAAGFVEFASESRPFAGWVAGF